MSSTVTKVIGMGCFAGVGALAGGYAVYRYLSKKFNTELNFQVNEARKAYGEKLEQIKNGQNGSAHVFKADEKREIMKEFKDIFNEWYEKAAVRTIDEAIIEEVAVEKKEDEDTVEELAVVPEPKAHTDYTSYFNKSKHDIVEDDDMQNDDELYQITMKDVDDPKNTYDLITFDYFANGVMTDDDGTVYRKPEEVVGPFWAKKLRQEEFEDILLRDDDEKRDLQIIFDPNDFDL